MKNQNGFIQIPLLVAIIAGILVVVILAFIIYLKNYRLAYCQTLYPSTSSVGREECLTRPLLKFIF